MSNEEENVDVVKNFFAAIGSGDKQALLALVDEGIEWIIPGEDWPLAGTHRGHAGVAAVLRKAAEEIETTYPNPPEFVAQGGPGLGRWSRYWEDQGHHEDVQGRLGLRHHHSKWQSEKNPGVHRHSSPGEGFGRRSAVRIVEIVARYLLGIMFTVFRAERLLKLHSSASAAEPVSFAILHRDLYIPLLGFLLRYPTRSRIASALRGYFVPLALVLLAAEIFNILALPSHDGASNDRSRHPRRRPVGISLSATPTKL